MKLTVYPSGKGDCLLLESGGKLMLIDGGIGDSFITSVLPKITNVKKLDCVYLSHIDDDHIGGLIELVNATFDWRVFEYRKTKDPKAKNPKSPRPPEIGKVWHNSFSDVLKENATPVAAAIQQTSAMLTSANSSDPHVVDVKTYHANLAESIRQSLNLRFRLSPDQLDIPVNPEYGGDLMHIRKKANPPQLKLGTARLTLLGPFAEDLEKQRNEWNAWLKANKAIVSKVRQDAKGDAGDLTNKTEALAPIRAAANALAESMVIPQLQISALDPKKAALLGDRGAVTTPNLASLMFLVSENGKAILLTGDGHADDLLKGLEHAGALDEDGNLHVDVLKVQHHGSEHNMTQDFARRITADHYVFCGNGFSNNPELVVIEALAHARFGSDEERSTNPKADGKFKFWFNSTKTSAQYREHMKAVEDLVKKLVPESDGRLEYSFNSQEFEVPF
jgi:beta-lactamase superfamily II metal-dependent hydrolase